jgi:hypothetical protein
VGDGSCKEPYKQLFTEVGDVLVDECMVEEAYYSMIPRFRLHILNQTKEGTDLYGDAKREPIYDRTILIPINIELRPQESLLTKYGMDEKREAIATFSKKICHDLGYEPKVGDRIDFTYRTSGGAVVNEHFIIVQMAASDFQRQLIDNFTLTAGLERTQYKYKPDPTGKPADPKPLPWDASCLKDL